MYSLIDFISVPASAVFVIVLLPVLGWCARPQEAKPITTVVRLTEVKPGSAFSATEDGKYHYRLRDGDLEIAVAVDSQELEKVRHRPVAIFGLSIEFHHSGQSPVEIKTHQITLEFVKHYRVVCT